MRGGVRVRVCGVVVRDGRLLLIAHRKREQVYWLLPGGGVRRGETLLQALRREFREELGVDVDASGLAFICDSIEPRGRRHILNIAFNCTVGGTDFRLGRERRLHDFGFFDRAEVSSIRLYPPVNGTLVSIMDDGDSQHYLGCLWRE